MRSWIGTSGYSYKAWVGSFYPKTLAANEMLSFYASHLNSVEVNNTFYRFPTKSLLQSWRKQVSPDFRFVIKAPKKITHFKRLKDAEKEVHDLCDTLSVLGKSLGALLFQLPPNLSKDMGRLRTFLSCLMPEIPVAFEFRHASWFDNDVYDALREYNCALCLSETDDNSSPNLTSTADFGYLRLRRANYTKSELEQWKERIRSHNWQHVYVYFKHEDAGVGPSLAADFTEMMRE